MSGHGKLKRFAAVFVLAFICLNAGGALCVAYCQGLMAAPDAEHRARMEPGEHCEQAAATESATAKVTTAEQPDCCTMTVSFFAGPIEKYQFSVEPVAELVETRAVRAEPVLVPKTKVARTLSYHDPPIDRRLDRVKNCLIRI